MGKNILTCDVCGKEGFKSIPALKSHKNAVHGGTQSAGGETLAPVWSAPAGTPPGYAQTNCPTCRRPATVFVKEDGTIASSSELPKEPDSSSAARLHGSALPKKVGPHAEIIKARFKMRWNEKENRWKRTVAMSGTHGRTAPEMPWHESGIDERWLLNDSHGIVYVEPHVKAGRVDRWWQMHHRWRFTRRQTRHASDHWQWLQDVKTVPRIVMQRKYREIPNSEGFKFREISEKLMAGKIGRGAGWVQYYYTNTFSYMFAQVIYEKIMGIHDWERIELYGCELEQLETEYFRQRPGLEFWFGMAAAFGIEIYTPHSCFMLYAQDVINTNMGSHMVQYPGYMAYGYLSPSKMEAVSKNELLGVDPIEENIIGSWDDSPFTDFLYAANEAFAVQQKLHYQSNDTFIKECEEINKWMNQVAVELPAARPSPTAN